GLDESVRCYAERDRHATARRRESDRIADQIHENLLELVAVALDHRKVLDRRDLQRQLSFRSHSLQAACRKGGNLTNANRFDMERRFLETRPIEQLFDDTGKPGHVAFYTSQISALLLIQWPRHAVKHVFRKAADRRHGRS